MRKESGDLIFRLASPQDADAAVPLMYSAGPEAFNYVFSVATVADAQQFLRVAFLGGTTQFGWRNIYVAELNGRVVATAAAWGADRTASFTVQSIWRFAQVYGIRNVWGVMFRGLLTERILQPPRKGCLFIACLGVDPACRGAGVGAGLIHWLKQQANARGYARLALDVAVTNPRAQALYERIGFHVIEERASSLRNSEGFVADSRYMEWSYRQT